MADIHNRKEKLKRNTEKLKKADLSKNNILKLIEFKNHLFASGLSKDRICRYISCFNALSNEIGFDLASASRDQLVELVGRINQDMIGDQEHSPYTLNEYRKAVKKFYVWHTGEEDPKVVDFISTGVKKSERPRVDRSELPTPSQVAELRKQMLNSRDKAFITLLWETGGRISEVLNLKWKHVFNDDGLWKVKFTESKTMQRSVPFRKASSYVLDWKAESNHSRPDDWVFHRLSDSELVSYRGMQAQVQRAFGKVETDFRHNFHAFRKSRATYLASKGFNVYQLMKFFGWTNSETALYYVKLAQSDVDRAFLELMREEKSSSGPGLAAARGLTSQIIAN